jgi:DNA (cytosine-5)-methyltransferase 1
MPRIASMFAGIGGICKGFLLANPDNRVVWANEIDRFACITYRANFGNDYLVEGDIRNINTTDIPDMDILTAGFPCQAFSIAGYRRGFEDDRGNLFFETLRVIRDKRPRAFLIENVKNLVSHDGGNTFRVITEALEQEGYFLRYRVLNSMEYGNVPQNRERIYIVGFNTIEDRDNFDFPDPIPLARGIHDIVNANGNLDERYYYDGNTNYHEMLREAVTNPNTIYQLRRIYVRENMTGVCPTLTANMGTGGHNVPLILDANNRIRKLTPRECLSFQGFPENFIIPENISNAQIYKQVGNAVTVTVIRRIAERMLEAMRTTNEVNAEQEVAVG